MASSFLDFIDSQPTQDDLKHFLKITYIKWLIQSPSYMKNHENLLQVDVLSDILEQEKDNPYLEYVEKTSQGFFSSQKGALAYDFEAKLRDGSLVKLSDFKGKLVFVDNWATWCRPCIGQRPHVDELAKKYKNDDRIVFLYISIDEDHQKWMSFLEGETNTAKAGLDVIIGIDQKANLLLLIKSVPGMLGKSVPKNGITYPKKIQLGNNVWSGHVYNNQDLIITRQKSARNFPTVGHSSQDSSQDGRTDQCRRFPSSG